MLGSNATVVCECWAQCIRSSSREYFTPGALTVPEKLPNTREWITHVFLCITSGCALHPLLCKSAAGQVLCSRERQKGCGVVCPALILEHLVCGHLQECVDNVRTMRQGATDAMDGAIVRDLGVMLQGGACCCCCWWWWCWWWWWWWCCRGRNAQPLVRAFGAFKHAQDKASQTAHAGLASAISMHSCTDCEHRRTAVKRDLSSSLYTVAE